MNIKKHERPETCQHKDCQFILIFQNSICGGKMPKPLPHDSIINTHRICFLTEEDKKPFDLQINKTDAWWMIRALNKMFALVLCFLLIGCASPCMKKTTVLEQKQCKWDQRGKRDVNILGIGSIGALISLPMVAGCVFSKKCSPQTFPILSVSWGLGMFSMFDMEYFRGPYPRPAHDKGKE